MKSARKPAHSPGAQGHTPETLSKINQLREQNADAIGNQANPDYTERVGSKALTDRLFNEQADRTYANRQITQHRKGANKSDVNRKRRGDDNGTG